MSELTAAERDRIYTAAQDEDWLASLYLLGMQAALSNPVRARELLGWTFTGYQMTDAPKVVVASEVGGYSMTNRGGMDDDMYHWPAPLSAPVVTLEQRIVGASHAEGAE